LVIRQLRQASEGVKEKLLCGHLLLCQHLLSCSYSTSHFVCPSTKVSPMHHRVPIQTGTHSQDSFTGFLSKWELIHKGTHSQDSFTGFLFTTVHVLQPFYTCSSAKNKKNSSHSIMGLSFQFMFSLLHDLTINQ
jgi:hypothetical protein